VLGSGDLLHGDLDRGKLVVAGGLRNIQIGGIVRRSLQALLGGEQARSAGGKSL